jgi:hypothetical protein
MANPLLSISFEPSPENLCPEYWSLVEVPPLQYPAAVV